MPELIRGVQELNWLYVPCTYASAVVLADSHTFGGVREGTCRLPTAVQAEAIPLALGGGDLLVVRTPVCSVVHVALTAGLTKAHAHARAPTHRLQRPAAARPAYARCWGWGARSCGHANHLLSAPSTSHAGLLLAHSADCVRVAAHAVGRRPVGARYARLRPRRGRAGLRAHACPMHTACGRRDRHERVRPRQRLAGRHAAGHLPVTPAQQLAGRAGHPWRPDRCVQRHGPSRPRSFLFLAHAPSSSSSPTRHPPPLLLGLPRSLFLTPPRPPPVLLALAPSPRPHLCLPLIFLLRAGKYCFEVTAKDAGLCRVGWATATASLSLGTDGNGFGYGGTGKKSVAGKFEDYGEPYGAGDTITCCVDRTAGTITYYKNGTTRNPPRLCAHTAPAQRSAFHRAPFPGKALGVAFKIPRELATAALFPTVLLKVRPPTCSPSPRSPPLLTGVGLGAACTLERRGLHQPGRAWTVRGQCPGRRLRTRGPGARHRLAHPAADPRRRWR